MRKPLLALALLALAGCGERAAHGGAAQVTDLPPLRLPLPPRPPQPAQAPPPTAPAHPARPRPPRAPAALPPGAPPDWLREIRTSRSRLQAFTPFDISFDYDDGLDVGRGRRRITVARMRVDTLDGTVRPGLLYVIGWCHLRQAVRTFRADRMSALRDEASGSTPTDIRAFLLGRADHG